MRLATVGQTGKVIYDDRYSWGEPPPGHYYDCDLKHVEALCNLYGQAAMAEWAEDGWSWSVLNNRYQIYKDGEPVFKLPHTFWAEHSDGLATASAVSYVLFEIARSIEVNRCTTPTSEPVANSAPSTETFPLGVL